MQRGESGSLYVISTPIGNLGDLTPRAAEILADVDLIACEDTRVTGKLLSLLVAERPELISYRDENELDRAEELCEKIRHGTNIALVSDAGTPAISDPGFRLVRACHNADLPVISIPGACAVTAALSISGLPSDRFFFVGFLPPKSAARRRFLEEHAEFPSTIILYESVHRIEKLLGEITDVLGANRSISVSRELTKKFETTKTGTAESVRDSILSQARKGEFVVLIAPASFQL